MLPASPSIAASSSVRSGVERVKGGNVAGGFLSDSDRRVLDRFPGEVSAETGARWPVLTREALLVSYLECLSDAASLHMICGEHGELLRLAWAILADTPAS